MRAFLCLVLALCVLQTAVAAPLMALRAPGPAKKPMLALRPQSMVPTVGASKTECKICLDFADEALQDLIQIIAEVGVGGGCEHVCGLLEEKTNSKVLGTVCEVLCEVIGIEEFAKLVNEVDPDPIALCSEGGMCPHTTTANATIGQLMVQPATGHQGSTFAIEMEYEVVKDIATGTVDFNVLPPAGFPFGDGEVVIMQGPGTYGVKLSFKAQPNEQQPFLPGTYIVQSAVCEGTCGSKHKWTKTLATKNTTFTITQ